MNMNLLAGTGVSDITPPLDAGILLSSVHRKWAPFHGLRRPLHARALVIECNHQRVALVSLELLGLSDRAIGGRIRFKERIVQASSNAIAPDQLVLASTHTHSAPESVALTDLYRTDPFQDWIELLAERIGQAVADAVASLQPCLLSAGSVLAPGLSIYRRIRTTEGIVLSHPPPPPEIVISREGSKDDLVNVVILRTESSEIAAIVVNAVCHPVHEMHGMQISPDYPGEMSLVLESQYPTSAALFLNGAAGNINPPTVSGGPDGAVRHGQQLARAVHEVIPQLQSIRVDSIALQRSRFTVPARQVSGNPSKRRLSVEIAAMRLGYAAFLFIPAEVFVEIGLAIRQQSPFAFTAVAGYAEDYVGYIPVDAAFDEGGYELGPGRWARVGRGAAALLQGESLALLGDLAVDAL